MQWLLVLLAGVPAALAVSLRPKSKLAGGKVEWTTMLIVDSNYLEIFGCWADAYVNSGSRSHVRVNVLDSDGYDKLRASYPKFAIEPVAPAAETQTLHAWPPMTYMGEYWRQLKVTLEASPGAVLHSDADAFYLRSPDKMIDDILEEYPDADIIAQTGLYPREASSEWGFSLNTGFSWHRKTPAVMKMIDDLMDSQDDMKVMNIYLRDLGCKWEPMNEDRKYPVLRKGRCGEIGIVALKWAAVSRNIHATENRVDGALIFHPSLHLEKGNQGKDQLRASKICKM